MIKYGLYINHRSGINYYVFSLKETNIWKIKHCPKLSFPRNMTYNAAVMKQVYTLKQIWVMF